MIDLSTMGMRALTVFAAARDAARSASRATNYETAKSKAVAAAYRYSSPSTRINANEVKTIFDRTITNSYADCRSGEYQRPVSSNPLKTLSESELEHQRVLFTYECEVQVTGDVEPLFRLNSALFGSVPGVTVPWRITASSREFVEHPDGLAAM
jgi:Flp pilus assembly protein TadG